MDSSTDLRLYHRSDAILSAFEALLLLNLVLKLIELHQLIPRQRVIQLKWRLRVSWRPQPGIYEVNLLSLLLLLLIHSLASYWSNSCSH